MSSEELNSLVHTLAYQELVETTTKILKILCGDDSTVAVGIEEYSMEDVSSIVFILNTSHRTSVETRGEFLDRYLDINHDEIEIPPVLMWTVNNNL